MVGGGLAATRAVEELRRLGCSNRVTLVGEEPHPPYDRPPLSKEVLRGERPDSPLREDWAELDVDLQLGRRAVALDLGARHVLLDYGAALTFDSLVIATGAAPRTLPGLAGPGVHALRTIEDARALAEDVRSAGRLTVVGGGFIGCEVASSARRMQAQVTLVELLPTPLARVLGTTVGAHLASLHEADGVQLRCGVAVVEAQDGTGPRQLLLGDGSTVDAEVVVVGLGVLPSTGWLEGSGLQLDDGVVCDARGRTSAPGVWAAGDAARWLQPSTGGHRRAEHWTSAADQGAAVARDLMGTGAPLDEVPYFWSDQCGVKLQVLGLPDADDDVELLRVGPDPGRLLAVYGRAGRVTAVLGASAPRFVMRLRPLLAAGASYDEALATARS